MKIAVCGKGGSGKSTVTTLLGRYLEKQGKEVLIIDSDESNYGLHRHLGMDNPVDFTEYFGGKQEALSDLMASQFSYQFIKETWKIKDIPEKYYTESDGIKLMVSGKIKQVNEGCSCTMGAIIKQFVANLQMEDNQIAILDMEAGIEHFGRGIDDEVDVILMVCDPAYESVQFLHKIDELGKSIGKTVYFVLNKMTPEAAEVIKKEIADSERILAVLPVNPEIQSSALKGGKIEIGETESDEIRKIAEKL